jgi:hypothetical protein
MSNLSSFNIKNLFFDKKSSETPVFTGKIDVKALTVQKSNSQNYEFDPEKLLIQEYEKRENLKNYYNEIFKKCCETIFAANKDGLKSLVYEIPKYSEHEKYSCFDCVEMLKKKLEEKFMDVHKDYSNPRLIHVSWKNLEEKLKKKSEKSNN